MFHSVINPIVRASRKFEKPRPELCVVIDDFAGKDFNINEAGWIRNDIATLARAQTLAEAQLVMQRLQEVKAAGNLPDGITDQEAFDQVIPRYAQHPSELEMMIQMSNDSVVKSVNDAYARAMSVKNTASVHEESSEASSEGN